MSTASTGQTQKLPQTTKFSAAVIPSYALVRIATWALWVIAIVLFVVSAAGNYAQFNGGWARFWVWDDAAKRALLYAIIWQVGCSALQFAFLKVKVWPAYFAFLGASAIPTALSYVPVVFPVMVAFFARAGMPSGIDTTLATILLGVAVLGLDSVPEQILVKR